MLCKVLRLLTKLIQNVRLTFVASFSKEIYFLLTMLVRTIRNAMWELLALQFGIIPDAMKIILANNITESLTCQVNVENEKEIESALLGFGPL